jgi:ATP-binding cassette, subfamily B, bacterial
MTNAPRSSPLLRAFELGRSAAGWTWLASLALSCLSGLFVPVAAWLSRALIESLIAAHKDPREAVLLAAGVGASGVLSALSSSLSSLLSAQSQRSIMLEAAERLFRAVNRMPGIACFEDPAYQDKLRLAEQASQDTPGTLCNLLLAVLQSTFTLVGFAGALLIIWPPLPLILAAVLVPSILAERTLGRRQAALSAAATPEYRRYVSYRTLLTTSQGAKEVRIFGIGDFLATRLVYALRRSADKQLAGQRHASRIQATVACLIGTAVIVSTGYVAYSTVVGHLSVGDFVLFTAALAWAQGSTGSLLSQSSMLLASLNRFRSFLEVLRMPGEGITGVLSVPPLSRGIEFDNVWFRYTPDSEWVFRGLSVSLPAGQSTGLVGLNGAGKSTLVKLLCRFYEPERGAIRWDGLDLRDCAVESLRQRVAVTFQDFATYELSARECIGIGRLSRLADQDAIEAAARLAEVDETLKSLRFSYDTMLSRIFVDPETGHEGVTLSGGQNQRVALARMLMRGDADLMILDEPSSGLDAEAEHKIHQALRRCRTGKSNLLISHRLSALRDADRILVLDDGAVSESGNHDELIAAGGQYAALFAIQSEGYLEPVSGV